MRILPSLWFLIATVRYKRFVYQAGRRLGVARWQLVVHNLSKFRPSEFVPYGRFLYAAPARPGAKRCRNRTRAPEMREAWVRHIQRNAHHWQHWVLIMGGSVVSQRDGASRGVEADIVEALPMSERLVLHDETRRLLAAAVADWFRSDQVNSE
jgi:hypothetical protein